MLGSLGTCRRSQAIASLSYSLLPFYFSYGKPPFLQHRPTRDSAPLLPLWYFTAKWKKLPGYKRLLYNFLGTQRHGYKMYTPTSFSDLVCSTTNTLMISCHWFFCWVSLLVWFFCFISVLGFFSKCWFHKWCNKPFKKLDQIPLSLLSRYIPYIMVVTFQLGFLIQQ